MGLFENIIHTHNTLREHDLLELLLHLLSVTNGNHHLFIIIIGGRNLSGHPVIHFPNEAFPKLQQCTTGDLLLLLKSYVKIAGPKVAILVDMRTRWTESDIIKVITSFDELQVENDLQH